MVQAGRMGQEVPKEHATTGRFNAKEMEGQLAARQLGGAHVRECVGRAGRVGMLPWSTAPVSRHAITPCRQAVAQGLPRADAQLQHTLN
jgi:hypothetical protein